MIADIINSFDGIDNLTLEGSIPEIVIDIDLGRFKFLVRNLIENALTHYIDSSHVLIACKKSSNQLIISVRDFGSGMDEQFLSKVFEPFSQAENVNNRSNKGVGLGLFLCKRIALAHGGDLSVKSELGKGSTFIFKLPIAA